MWAQTTNTHKPGAGVKSQSNPESGGEPTNVQASEDKSVPFDVDVGFAATWAAARPKVYGEPAHYILSVSPTSPGFSVLLSVAGKISRERLAVINEAFREFKKTNKPVVKQSGDLKHRGDFRVKADQDTLELDNLWKPKGL